MWKNSFFKSMIYKAIVLSVVASTMLCGCKKKDTKENEVSVQKETDESNESKNDKTGETEVEQVKDKEDEKESNQTEKPKEQTVSKDYSINSGRVIQNAVSGLKVLIPKMVYSENMISGQTVEITVSKELSEQDISGSLHDSILDLMEYNLYLEYQNNPQQANPVVIDHTYSIKYKGFSYDNANHIFEIKFVMNEQHYKDANFDSDVVVAKVAERILSHTEFHMSRLEGSEYSEARMIEGVQTYEWTEQAAESLARYVENEIDGLLFGMAKYTQFKLEFYAKSVSAYTFILYLK